MCESKVPGDKFYVQRKLFCGDYIESQYYNHLGGKKANNSSKDSILVTFSICAICYSFRYILSDAEIKRIRNILGKNPLLICRDCFNSIIKILTSGGSSKALENQGQKGASKTRKLQVTLQISNKKDIK